MKEEWFLSLQRLIESKYAPKWNSIIGDRITKEDYLFVKEYEKELYEDRKFHSQEPNSKIIEWIRKHKFSSYYFYERLKNISLEREFLKIRPMTREDLQNRITEILPTNTDFTRMVVNPTSGTTGKPILAPNHPRAIGCYVPLIEYSLKKHGVDVPHKSNITSGIQICHQNETIVYATTHSLAEGSLFAKINLKEKEWQNPSDINTFLFESDPIFLSGDPYSFESAMKTGINFKPKALHSTALELEDNLRDQLALYFQCPIVNFYSLNETGPIAYSCPIDPDWMHILPNDIHMEILNEEGEPDELGEIVITGGRNPFLPLLRYKTGDWGRIKYGNCLCGEASPKVQLLKGRKPIFFTDTKGRRINPVDISRILRRQTNVLRHQFIQKKNGSYIVNLSTYLPPGKSWGEELKILFQNLLGESADILFDFDLPNDGKKITVFINENIDLKS